MDNSKLIRTPTGNMTKEQWLDFRRPLTHVTKFILQHCPELYPDGCMDPATFKRRDKKIYDILVEFFKTDLWDDFIFPCVGASEMGTVLGLNKWKSSVELFYEKVGIKDPFIGENAAMFWGTHLEKEIADKWQYWDGSIEGMIDNYNSGQILRRCRNVHFYIQNKETPWIFVSLDRLINQQKNPAGEVIAKEGCLECKTIAGYYAQQWESGTPPEYIIQIQTQIGTTALQYGELAILIDGREMQVLPFDFRPTLYEAAVTRSSLFFEKVKKAIAYQILSDVCPNELMQKRFIAGVDSLSPDPDGSVSYQDYLKETFKDEGFKKTGDELDLQFAIRHEKLKAYATLLLEQRRLCANYLKTSLKGYNEMSFGELDPGRVTWKKNKNGIRSLKIYVRVPDLDLLTLEEMLKPDEGKKAEHDPKFHLP